MSFRFMSNKIDTRSVLPTLSEVVKLANTKKALASSGAQTKLANTTTAKKKVESDEENEGAEKEDEGEENKAFPGAAPKFKKKDAKEAKASTKVAEKDREEGESSGQQEPAANKNNDPEKPKGGAKTSGGKKGGESDEAEGSGQLEVEPHHQEGESTGKKPAGLDTMKDSDSVGTSDKSEKKSSSTGRFVKVAELTGKQKEFLRKTWSMYWPKSFIDALLA